LTMTTRDTATAVARGCRGLTRGCERHELLSVLRRELRFQIQVFEDPLRVLSDLLFESLLLLLQLMQFICDIERGK